MKDFMNNEWKSECIACEIDKGNIIPPGGIIKETENFFIQQDLETPLKGFLVIVSKKHLKSIAQLTLDEVTELTNLIYKSRLALNEISDINEVVIIQEERSNHFHVWLFPRYNWMNKLFENSLTDIRKIMQYVNLNMKNEKNIKEVLSTADFLRNLMQS
ncbi:HIT family hydrolase [Clostridium sp. UBA1056]|uniref:HIT family protein n=1 Tax=unclassified Clostridium TaxID=2614128 RepID=UPI003216E8DF